VHPYDRVLLALFVPFFGLAAAELIRWLKRRWR
jgi:hypothetical protein